MNEQWIVPVWAALVALAVVVLLALALVLALTRSSARSRAETAALRARVDDLVRDLASAPTGSDGRPDGRTAARSDGREYVITDLTADGEPTPAPAPAPTIEGRLFADLVLRESVVRTAATAAGLRRALSPQARNRIRFEMRRGVKGSRKARRAEVREALQHWRARQRTEDAG